MNRMPKICCSRCGSENTEVRNSPPDAPSLIGLAERLLRRIRPGGPLLSGGRHVIVCRDCGYVACLYVR